MVLRSEDLMDNLTASSTLHYLNSNEFHNTNDYALWAE